MRRLLKWTGRIVIGVLALAGVTIAAVFFWFRSGLPDFEATERLVGLEAPVRVMRDENAVPHVFAAYDEDAYFALGYLHASDRLWQMEAMRRLGAGRLSEIFDSEFSREVDRSMRLLGLYRNAEASLTQLPEPVTAALDAYAAGVNAWLENRSGPLPPEFLLTGTTPEPWRPADSAVWGRLISLFLSFSWRQELERAQLSLILDDEQIAELFPVIGGPPRTLSNEDLSTEQRAAAPPPPTGLAPVYREAEAPLQRALAAIPQVLGPMTASNEWVVDGNQTESGLPILANDPHLMLQSPNLWYLARIETPGFMVTGATVPGVPFHVLAHNGTIAWGMTTTGTDVQDLFIERLDPDDPGRYLTPDGSEPFTVREERIRYGAGDDDVEVLTIRESRHGPILSDIEADLEDLHDETTAIALAWPALSDADQGIEGLYRLNRATGWQEFLDAVRLMRSPNQNIVYADVAGNIGFIVNGEIPIRDGWDGTMPVPGWSGEFAWSGLIPFEELPQTFNPERGRIVNANNRVDPPDYRHFLHFPYEEGYRAARIEEMLDQTGPQTVDTTTEAMTDIVSLAARDLLPHMLRFRAREAGDAEALSALRLWDHRMDRDRPEPLLFTVWLRELNRALYADELGELFESYWHWRPTVVRQILTENQDWCDDVGTEAVTEDCDAVLSASFAAAVDWIAERHGDDPEAWRWGDEHVAPLTHQVWSRVPLLSSLFDIGIETDGGFFTVNRGAMGFQMDDATDTPFSHVHGAGYRAVYDMADLANSRFMIATGQSGHPLSPHYGDLVEIWRDRQHIAITGSAAELTERGLGTLALNPAEPFAP